MRFLFWGLLYFALPLGVHPQDIFIPFKGRKEIIKIDDPTVKRGNLPDGHIDRLGDRCGDYFFYEQVHDQQILSFGRPPTRQQSEDGTVVAIERIGLPLISVKLDDNAEVPTAQWRSAVGGLRMIFGMSKKDYENARCLPRVQEDTLELIT